MRMSAAWRRPGGGDPSRRESAAFPRPLLVFISISVGEETRCLAQAGNLPAAELTQPLQTLKEAA